MRMFVSPCGHRRDLEGSPITPLRPVPVLEERLNGYIPMAPPSSHAERMWAPVEGERQPMDVNMPMAPPSTHAERMWAPVEGERQPPFLVYY